MSEKDTNIPTPTTGTPISPDAASVANISVSAASSKPKDPVKEYENKIQKMSDKQLRAELVRKTRNQERPRINEIFANVLLTVFDSHKRGMASHLRG